MKHLLIAAGLLCAAAEPARLGEMMTALKGVLERHGAAYPIGTDGRALTPVLPRAPQ